MLKAHLCGRSVLCGLSACAYRIGSRLGLPLRVNGDSFLAMNSIIEEAYDPESFRKLGKQLVDLLADYLAAAVSRQPMPVLPACDPEAQFQNQERWLREDTGFAELMRTVIQQSNHLHHPRYVGHQVSAPVPLTALCELTGTLLNNASAVYEMGPVSVAMERVVIKEMARVLGFAPKADGIFTSGGTLGNLTALLAARQAKAPFDVWQEGMCRGGQLAFMVPANAHYSVTRGLRIAGFGNSSIIAVPANDKFQTDATVLEELYQEALRHGQRVIGLSANACSTATGTYDDLALMADFCERHQLWFHVDAAHGAPAVFSDQHRHLIQGIDRADSVVIDFHKMMNAPALLTMVLYRNPTQSFEAFSQQASYLFEAAESQEWFNMSKRTLECTKRMMGLTVFALWKFCGPRFFSACVDRTYALASQFAEVIRRSSDFVLAIEPQANIVCFRYVSPSLNQAELNLLNKRLRKLVLAEGSFYIVQTDLAGYTWLRTALMNPMTQLSDLEHLLDRIRHF